MNAPALHDDRSVNPRPRLLVVVKSNGFGGVERKVSGLVSMFPRHGIDCDVATLAAEPAGGLLDSIPRIVLDDGGSNGVVGRLRQLRQLRRLVGHTTYTALMGFGPSANALVALSRRPRGRRGPRTVIAEVGDPFIERRSHWNRRWMWTYLFADTLLLQTERLATELRASRRRPRRIVVIPGMVSPALPRVPAESPRQDLIAGVGRLVASKRFDDLIEAFDRVGPVADGWRVVIVGDGPERTRLEALAAARGQEHRVVFTGWDEAPWTTLAHAAIFVQCSAHEGFPTTLLEAMASGCAVVSSDCRFGPREILGEEGAEFLYPVGDVDALADLLRRLIQDPARRTALVQTTAARLDHFTPEVVTAQWLALLCGGSTD
jgi:glycosyltransferase involved in cell wall biosynthesis